MTGLRIIRPHGHASASPGRFRDGAGLHIHDTKAPTSSNEGRRQELDSGTKPQPTALPSDSSSRSACPPPLPPSPQSRGAQCGGLLLKTRWRAPTLTLNHQACLNAPEPNAGNENGVDDTNQVESPEEPAPQHLPPQQQQQQPRPGMPPNPHMQGNYMPAVGIDPSHALAYQSYVQRGGAAPYGMPPQSGMPQHAGHQS